jgi:hypothetical protein
MARMSEMISLLGQAGTPNPLPSTPRFVDLCYLKAASAY